MSRRADDVEAPGPRRRVAIDWDMLELALSVSADGADTFLDLRSGEVRHASRSGDDPEGALAEQEVETGFGKWLIRIDRISTDTGWNWMAEFAGSVGDPRLRGGLRDAIRGRGAFRRFEDIPAGHPRGTRAVAPVPRRARPRGDARVARRERPRARHAAAPAAGMRSATAPLGCTMSGGGARGAGPFPGRGRSG